MIEERPSIAELQRAHVVAIDDSQDDVAFGNARDDILRATSVLLEIAAAALAAEEARAECDKLSSTWMEQGGDYEPIARAHARIDETVRARRAALRKVRP